MEPRIASISLWITQYLGLAGGSYGDGQVNTLVPVHRHCMVVIGPSVVLHSQ